MTFVEQIGACQSHCIPFAFFSGNLLTCKTLALVTVVFTVSWVFVILNSKFIDIIFGTIDIQEPPRIVLSRLLPFWNVVGIPTSICVLVILNSILIHVVFYSVRIHIKARLIVLLLHCRR